MESPTILMRLKAIPVLPLMSIAEDHEVWEGREYGGQFKVTRHQLPIPFRLQFIALTASGAQATKLAILEDFQQALGAPAEIWDEGDGFRFPISASWLTDDELNVISTGDVTGTSTEGTYPQPQTPDSGGTGYEA